jgi:hypothetical protein
MNDTQQYRIGNVFIDEDACASMLSLLSLSSLLLLLSSSVVPLIMLPSFVMTTFLVVTLSCAVVLSLPLVHGGVPLDEQLLHELQWTAMPNRLERSHPKTPSPTTISALGGVMRIDTPIHEFERRSWQREIANLFDTEVTDINVFAARPGSTVVYFQIDDPRPPRAGAAAAPTTLSLLSGDEKMLLLYQWWVQRDRHIQEARTSTINSASYICT